jgi:poly-gamma-glutamate capsule biosynthesis protein CapA/YwtB (metallophosphatase superfamily)
MAAPPAARGGLAVALLGDAMLGRRVDAVLAARAPDAAFVWGDRDALPLLRGGLAPPGGAELNFANLETAVTTHERPSPGKAFNFKMAPANVGALCAAQLRVVSLADSHALDYGARGLEETLETLSGAGVAAAGAGVDAAAAAAPAVVRAGGIGVAFLAMSDHPAEWAATPRRPGINYIDPERYDRAALAVQVDAARTAGDLLVVSVHWGPNWAWRPAPAIRALGRALVELGADVVFGHSSHHIQDIEVYHGKPIIYGAGDFVDDYASPGN